MLAMLSMSWTRVRLPGWPWITLNESALITLRKCCPKAVSLWRGFHSSSTRFEQKYSRIPIINHVASSISLNIYLRHGLNSLTPNYFWLVCSPVAWKNPRLPPEGKIVFQSWYWSGGRRIASDTDMPFQSLNNHYWNFKRQKIENLSVYINFKIIIVEKSIFFFGFWIFDILECHRRGVVFSSS